VARGTWHVASGTNAVTALCAIAGSSDRYESRRPLLSTIVWETLEVPEGMKPVYVPNVRFLYAMLGPKPGADRSLKMLPSIADMAGDGWRLLDQRTFRTGRLGRATEYGKRAHKLRSVTAIRSFEQVGYSRWLWAEVIPLASEEDAAAASDDALRVVRNPRVTVTNEHRVTGVSVPGSSSAWTYEQQTTGPLGNGVSLCLRGTAGSIIFVVMASGFAESWRWDDVVSIASLIVARVSERSD
jgi:hypothetical protein